jgi:hypothetical protein
MEQKEIERAVTEMKAYLHEYPKGCATKSRIPGAIRKFRKKWIDASSYSYPTKSGEKFSYQLCAECLCRYTHFLFLSSKEGKLKCGQVETANCLVEEFSKISPSHGKREIYYNLGLCWASLGGGYEDRALSAFKESNYFWLSENLNSNDYADAAYKFFKCSDYLWKSLEKQELSLSPPHSFNDPFDCPIYELLNNDETTAQLIRKAYHDCLTVACFTTSNKEENKNSDENVEEPYLNDLMWAHYADSHSGICIKYNLSIITLNTLEKSLTEEELLREKRRHIALQHIRYSSEKLKEYSYEDSITSINSFFLKGDCWNYEKELRLICYDPKGKGEYTSIPIPECIEAVYFGLRCSEEHKEKIKGILSGKKFVKNQLGGCMMYGKKTEQGVEISGSSERRLQEESADILFYEMKKDPEHFGRLIKVECTKRSYVPFVTILGEILLFLSQSVLKRFTLVLDVLKSIKRKLREYLVIRNL